MMRLRAMTLIELLISVAIFAVLTVGILGFTQVMWLGSATTTSRSTTSAAVGQVLHALTEDLRQAQVVYDEAVSGSIDGDGDTEVFTRAGILAGSYSVALDAGAQVLSYRVPVDHDLDSDVVDEQGSVEWGVELPQGSFPSVDLDANQLDGDGDGDGATRSNACTITVRFVAVPKLRYDEAATGVDLNGDGQLDDVFEVGHLEQTLHAPSAIDDLVLQITPNIVLQREGAAVSDIDEDGDLDPLFQLVSPTRLQLTLLCNQRWNGSSTLIEQETSILLRNEE